MSEGTGNPEHASPMVREEVFGIRLADTAEGRNSASMLVNRMYTWRGYQCSDLTDDPSRITLTATSNYQVVGTMTIGIDGPCGLLADDGFGDVVDNLRTPEEKLCEFTKLAFDPAVSSMVVLANLFHLALIYARDMYFCTRIIIEVNPRHKRFYERKLGFSRCADTRTSTRVGAPGILMSLSIDEASKHIKSHAATNPDTTKTGSFYSLFFSAREESGIIDRLRRTNGANTVSYPHVMTPHYEPVA
jgi:hypothetical protein